MTSTATVDTAEQIRQFILEELLYDRDDVELDDQTALLETGVVDSMGIFRLIDFIEAQFGLPIQAEDIRVEHFQNIDAIGAFIRSLKK